MTRISTSELTDQLPDVLLRVSERGEHFTIERDGIVLAVIQPPDKLSGPTLHELAVVLAGVAWPDEAYFEELAVVRDELNIPSDSPPWPS